MSSAALSAGIDPLSFADRNALESMDDGDAVDVAIKVAPASTPALKAALSVGAKWAEFPELGIVVARVPASAILSATDAWPIERIEIIDETMTERALMILEAVRRLAAVHDNLFPVGALNVSLGVPKALLGKNRSAEATIQEALGKIIAKRIPVVMSIGNDGPGEDTANPWALTPGVIIVTATDASGTTPWPASSRLRSDQVAGRTLFAAHGYLSVGAWAAGTSKTQAMLDAEKKVNLTALVGAGNEHLYRVDSGTSYAAAQVTHAICLIQQAAAAARFMLSGADGLQGVLPPYVAALFDSGIDRTHPNFSNRLADERHKYGGLTYETRGEQRKRLMQLVFDDILLDVRPTSAHVVEILRRAARPVPGAGAAEVGYGFVSADLVAAALEGMTLADFVEIFSDSSDARYPQWVEAARADNAPLFPPGDVDAFHAYCGRYSLIYMLKVL
jgi:hypothetical protein